MNITNNELINIYGGAVSGTLLNSIAKLISAVFDLGRSIGSSISMIKNKTKC